jgi:hypothetical protein
MCLLHGEVRSTVRGDLRRSRELHSECRAQLEAPIIKWSRSLRADPEASPLPLSTVPPAPQVGGPELSAAVRALLGLLWFEVEAIFPGYCHFPLLELESWR